jgi:hypothetical protein
MVPNHPRYQLRYTRLFDFCFLEISLSVVIPVVKGEFPAVGKARKQRRCKAFRHRCGTRPGYRRCAPKPGALPAALYPDIRFFYFSTNSPQSKVFRRLRSAPASRRRKKSANSGAVRLSGIAAGSAPDGCAAPGQAKKLYYGAEKSATFSSLMFSSRYAIIFGGA